MRTPGISADPPLATAVPVFLLTGFGPFCDVPENPSEAVLDALRRPDIGQKTLLDVSVHAVGVGVESLCRAAAEWRRRGYRPVVVHLGADADAERLRLESGAVNVADFSCPDNDGAEPRGHPIVPTLPFGYDLLTPLPLERISLAMPPGSCEVSPSGGTFVSNYLYFLSLYARCYRSLYVHLPLLETLPLDEQVRYVNEVLDLLARAVK